MRGSDPGSKGHILVVDDEPLNRELLEAILAPEGYSISHAESGAEAIDIVSAGGIDLVLLDVLMPGLDGIQTCRTLRERSADVPVVFVTAQHDRNVRIRGKEAGADDFLTKPVDEIELLIRVKNLLLVKAYHDMQRRRREDLEAELERVREQMLRVDRLATLGTLAAGVGHELLNAAAIFHVALSMVNERAAARLLPQQEDLDNLARVAEHITMHGKQLLKLGQPWPHKRERVDLSAVVKETLSMLRAAGRTKYVDVITVLPEGPLQADVVRARVEQLLANLVNNAADAIAEAHASKGRIIVRLEPGPEQGRARISVEDNGVGIDEANLNLIFEPYFTTKPPGKGTGLGLPVVKQIVAALGGRLTVQSRLGYGTTFAVEIPLGRL